jgi:hypothetical protein
VATEHIDVAIVLLALRRVVAGVLAAQAPRAAAGVDADRLAVGQSTAVGQAAVAINTGEVTTGVVIARLALALAREGRRRHGKASQGQRERAHPDKPSTLHLNNSSGQFACVPALEKKLARFHPFEPDSCNRGYD